MFTSQCLKHSFGRESGLQACWPGAGAPLGCAIHRVWSELAQRIGSRGCAVSIRAPVLGGDSRRSRCRWPAAVSIHAPVLGATTRRAGKPVGTIVSIHAPVLGATRTFNDRYDIIQFQSTPPCWGRPVSSRIRRWRISFNPRPRAGGDMCPNTTRGTKLVSIHAPVLGATISCRHGAHDDRVSIHAPVLGATP